MSGPMLPSPGGPPTGSPSQAGPQQEPDVFDRNIRGSLAFLDLNNKIYELNGQVSALEGEVGHLAPKWMVYATIGGGLFSAAILTVTFLRQLLALLKAAGVEVASG